MLNGQLDDRIWNTMENLQRLQIQEMGLKVFPNLQKVKRLQGLWAHNNEFTSLGKIQNLNYNTRLKHKNLNNNDLKSVVDFLHIAESFTSSLDVHDFS